MDRSGTTARRRFKRSLESGLTDGRKVPHDDLKDRKQHTHHEESDGNAKDEAKADTRTDQESRQQNQRRSTGSWEDPDSSILDDRRGDLPEFPCETLPALWQPWLPAQRMAPGSPPAMSRCRQSQPLPAWLAPPSGCAPRAHGRSRSHCGAH